MEKLRHATGKTWAPGGLWVLLSPSPPAQPGPPPELPEASSPLICLLFRCGGPKSKYPCFPLPDCGISGSFVCGLRRGPISTGCTVATGLAVWDPGSPCDTTSGLALVGALAPASSAVLLGTVVAAVSCSLLIRPLRAHHPRAHWGSAPTLEVQPPGPGALGVPFPQSRGLSSRSRLPGTFTPPWTGHPSSVTRPQLPVRATFQDATHMPVHPMGWQTLAWADVPGGLQAPAGYVPCYLLWSVQEGGRSPRSLSRTP